MNVGQCSSQTITVKEKDSAIALGSGSLNVFGTPAMIAYMEGLALKMVQNDIPEGCDTVGIGINAKHIKASPIGSKITFTSTVSAIDGKKISYSIEAKDEKGETIGSATHDRFIVDKERFMNKL
ncbi:MAG: thioesterase family protein [Paludibacteraceae bacterium]